ncbi:MAG: hypothetical protein ABIH57_02585 [Candidatus Omnitrophota bacterium]
MKFFDKRKKNIAVAVVLFILFIFANFYTVRKAARDAIELYFYDKLLVAYRIGGVNGLNTELNSVFFDPRLQQELKLAEKFKNDQKNIKDVGGFLKNITDKKRKAIRLARVMRVAAFGFIAVFLSVRFILNHSR